MKIETFSSVTISYMRRTGAYGPENAVMMETFKNYLKSQKQLNGDTVILGIALDNPQVVPEVQLRYDIGVVVEEQNTVEGLAHRRIEDGTYAVFEVAHTAEGVQHFWANMPHITSNLNVDNQRPIIERYASDKIKQHLCEFCIPVLDE